MNFLEDASKYLLAFPEAFYLLNFQSYEVLKFYPAVAPYLEPKGPNLPNEAILSHNCAARGNLF